MIILDYKQYDIYLQSKEGRLEFSEGCPEGRSRGTSPEEKSDLPELGLNVFHSFSIILSQL